MEKVFDRKIALYHVPTAVTPFAKGDLPGIENQTVTDFGSFCLLKYVTLREYEQSWTGLLSLSPRVCALGARAVEIVSMETIRVVRPLPWHRASQCDASLARVWLLVHLGPIRQTDEEVLYRGPSPAWDVYTKMTAF